VATVPDELLRDGKLECVGCHDPHPSNTNYKYLRVSTSQGAAMGNFCNLCHSAKSGKESEGGIFTSMDESKDK
jgi:predicted CXXCH cytochrome family protein